MNNEKLDEKLISRLKRGDQKALDIIIGRYSGYVCTVIRNFSRGALQECDIDELCADAFYKLWKIREKLEISVGLPAYLSAVARNLVKDRFKTLPPMSCDISELELASDIFVEDAAELNEMMKYLGEGVEGLSPIERETFTRFYIHGEKISRIATLTNRTEGAVRTALSRIREKLKKHLTERGYDHV